MLPCGYVRTGSEKAYLVANLAAIGNGDVSILDNNVDVRYGTGNDHGRCADSTPDVDNSTAFG